MDFSSYISTALFDELEKIAVSRTRLRLAQSRKGRRPMRVDTLLRKEREGTLYRRSGNEHKIAQVEPFVAGLLTGGEVRPIKRKGDLPSREELTNTPKREDGRGNATTVHGPSTHLLAPDVGGRERSE